MINQKRAVVYDRWCLVAKSQGKTQRRIGISVTSNGCKTQVTQEAGPLLSVPVSNRVQWLSDTFSCCFQIQPEGAGKVRDDAGDSESTKQEMPARKRTRKSSRKVLIEQPAEFAIAFANLATQKTENADDLVARNGDRSIFSVLRMIMPEVSHDSLVRYRSSFVDTAEISHGIFCYYGTRHFTYIQATGVSNGFETASQKRCHCSIGAEQSPSVPKQIRLLTIKEKEYCTVRRP